MLTAPRALGTVCEQRSSADHAFAVIKLPRSLHRNSKDERTVKTASLKPVSDNGLQRPLGLLGQIRSGTHPGQEHMTPPKAEYIAADLSLEQTNPCSRAADHTLWEMSLPQSYGLSGNGTTTSVSSPFTPRSLQLALAGTH
jgi:hypothetical protein